MIFNEDNAGAIGSNATLKAEATCWHHFQVSGSTEHDKMASHHDNYMSLVGALLWLSNVSRPELSYASSQLARAPPPPPNPLTVGTLYER